MKLLTWPDFGEPLDLASLPHDHFDYADFEKRCFCAGCWTRIPFTGPFWRWPTLGIVTCAQWSCFEAYKNNHSKSDIWAARERVLSRCENIPIPKPGREAPSLRQFLDLVLPVK